MALGPVEGVPVDGPMGGNSANCAKIGMTRSKYQYVKVRTRLGKPGAL